MHVICIKCQKHGSLSLNHYKSNGHRYQYYGIQHYDSLTKKRHWCYLGKYDSLPESYKTVIHNNQKLSTTDPQTQTTGKKGVFSENRGAGSGIRTHVALGHGILRAPIHDFREFCLVDLGLAEATVQIHVREITKFLHYMKRKRGPITRQHIRHYLMPYRNRLNVKRKILAALKRYFRDYLEQPDLVKSFKFPSSHYRPKQIANKSTLQAFFPHLPCEEAKLIFLFYASSGLRRNEALGLELKDIDLDQHLIIPRSNGNRTKHSYVTFFNNETMSRLEDYLTKRHDNEPRLFQFAGRTMNRWFEQAKHASETYLTPQRLREWFCIEMAERGVQDRFIDAFCGRMPRSILARHYTDYSPERLKRIYDNARLTVLT